MDTQSINPVALSPSVGGWRAGGRAGNVLSQILALKIRNNLKQLSMVPDNPKKNCSLASLLSLEVALEVCLGLPPTNQKHNPEQPKKYLMER